MSFLNAVSDAFSRYASFAGTSTRTQFWFWLLFTTIVLCVALIIDGLYLGPMWSSWQGVEDVLPFDQDAGNPLSIALLVLFALPTIAIAGRRLHDSAYSARWLLLVFTGIGIIPLLYFFVKKGTKPDQANQFRD